MLKKNVEFNKNLGFNLVEFMISIALSMSAILVVFSVYVTSFTIDSKTIRYSRLSDEVNAIKALFTDDLKRTGYREFAELLITTPLPPGNTSRCDPDPAVSGCSHDNFRFIVVDEFTDEVANSCILFAYDWSEDGLYNNGASGVASEDFGYRLRDQAIEIRRGGSSCTEGDWVKLTDPKFMVISNLTFTCFFNGVTTTACTQVNFLASDNTTVSIMYSFDATLAEDDSVTIQASDTVVMRNASYN